jgi:hypothetical protein
MSAPQIVIGGRNVTCRHCVIIALKINGEGICSAQAQIVLAAQDVTVCSLPAGGNLLRIPRSS